MGYYYFCASSLIYQLDLSKGKYGTGILEKKSKNRPKTTKKYYKF